MKADHILLALSLIFIVITLLLAGVSLRITDMALRVQTMFYATYAFFSGIATLILVEVMYLIKKHIARNGP
jgi:hypothetical protein